MKRLLEILLGLDKGFLSREGEFSLSFMPRWPWQETVGAACWNLVLGAAAAGLVLYVYRREARSRLARTILGALRMLLLGFVLLLLNQPVVTLTQTRIEPSVLAIMIDDSISMQVRDGPAGPDGKSRSRLEAVLDLLEGDERALVRSLADQHVLRFYRFDRDAQAIGVVSRDSPGLASSLPVPARSQDGVPEEPAPWASLLPTGQATQVLASLRTVLQELQGQRLAGVVLLTDGRSTPPEQLSERLAELRGFGARVYPVAVGSPKPPQNVVVETMDLQEAAFVNDIVSVRARVRASGYPSGYTVRIMLKDSRTGSALLRGDGRPAERVVSLSGESSQEVELTFRPTEPGTLDVVAEVQEQPGEIDTADNRRSAQVAVLDARIAVLYCEGYPRWDYRYLMRQMIRDKTVDISCLLFSADVGFAQEGDRPITRFPETMGEMLDYDVILFGDVDPRQFTDAQLQLVADFVAKKGGGFGMVAGPCWSPAAFRNTPIEPVLPVVIPRQQVPEDAVPPFRPVLSKTGQGSAIFRFFEDPQENERFLREGIQPLFWYSRGIVVKPGVGEAYAEHPTDLGPDGRKAPLLVLGRFGAGRTLFSAIDDSWRWRFYTGESVFDTYWVQQLRYLARARKLGQRRATLSSLRPVYELGQSIEVSVRILDAELLQQLPEQLSVVVEDGPGELLRREMLQRRQGETDLYVASWIADAVGRFLVRLPALAPGFEPMELPVEVIVPRLELLQPQVDQDLIWRLASQTLEIASGSGPDLARLKLDAQNGPATVRAELLKIPSAAMVVPTYVHDSLWNAPLGMAAFVVLIVMEWILRKVYGML